MARNTATAKWNGNLQGGDGRVALGQGAFEGGYTFKSRFEGDEDGTNPEELIAAAIAACFSMAASNDLHQAGIESESVDTTANVQLRNIDGAPTVAKIVLTTTVVAPGADESAVREVAEGAKQNCPVSRALASVPEVTLDLTLES